MKRVFWCVLWVMAEMFFASGSPAQNGKDVFIDSGEHVLSMQEYLETAQRKNTEFSRILLDELKIAYSQTLALPLADIVIDASARYGMHLAAPAQEYTDFSVGAVKTFSSTGTQAGAEYVSGLSSSTQQKSSEFEASLSQQIARNAFGRRTRMLTSITGMEMDIARFQVAEAYEEYFAEILKTYYYWFLAHENLATAKKALRENTALYAHIAERKNRHIAHENDMNKAKLQLVSKEEALILAESNYQKYTNQVKKICCIAPHQRVVPLGLALYDTFDDSFEKLYDVFSNTSRTYKLFDLLERRGVLLTSKLADELFPSISVQLGYHTRTNGYGISHGDEGVFAKVIVEKLWPDSQEKARVEVAKIDQEAARLDALNIRYRMYADLKNLYLEIEHQKELIAKAKEKEVLAGRVAEYESEDYSYGRSTLNDVIQSINAKVASAYDVVEKEVRLRILIVELLRLTDTLVEERAYRARQP